MRKIIVAQGMCSPIRNQVLTLFAPYGFKDLRIESYSITEGGRRGRDGAGFVGSEYVKCNVAEITVRPQAARWAEYIVCRSKKFLLMSKPIDPRNEEWAAKWNRLPKAGNWRQKGCNPPPPPKDKGQAKRRSWWNFFWE